MRTSCVTGFGVMALAASATLADWDAVSDFSTSANPAGVWSYGTRAAATGTTLSLLSDAFTDLSGEAVLRGWHDNANLSLGTPTVYTNVGAGAYVNGSLNIPAGTLAMHPGPTGFGPDGSREFSVVRWTAPSDLNLDAIVGSFLGLDSPGGRDVYVVHNGATIFSGFCDGVAATPFSLAGISVASGDVVDFVVGNSGSYFFDTTGLNAHISIVPAPAGLGLVGAGVLIATRRKR